MSCSKGRGRSKTYYVNVGGPWRIIGRGQEAAVDGSTEHAKGKGYSCRHSGVHTYGGETVK